MASQVLYGGFRRLGKFSVDLTSRVKEYRNLETYLSCDPTAYEGQTITVYGDEVAKNGIYYIIQDPLTKSLKPIQVVDGENFEIYLKEYASAVKEALSKEIDDKIKEFDEALSYVDKGFADRLQALEDFTKEFQIDETISKRVQALETFKNQLEDGSTLDTVVEKSIEKVDETAKESIALIDKEVSKAAANVILFKAQLDADQAKLKTEFTEKYSAIREELLLAQSKLDEKIAGVNGAIETLQKLEDLDQINESIHGLIKVYEDTKNNLAKDVEALTLKIEELEDALDTSDEGISERISAILIQNETFLEQSNKINANTAEISNIKTNYATNSKVDTYKNALDERIGAVEERLTKVNSELIIDSLVEKTNLQTKLTAPSGTNSLSVTEKTLVKEIYLKIISPPTKTTTDVVVNIKIRKQIDNTETIIIPSSEIYLMEPGEYVYEVNLELDPGDSILITESLQGAIIEFSILTTKIES